MAMFTTAAHPDQHKMGIVLSISYQGTPKFAVSVKRYLLGSLESPGPLLRNVRRAMLVKAITA
jgi:hypothetical protein